MTVELHALHADDSLASCHANARVRRDVAASAVRQSLSAAAAAAAVRRWTAEVLSTGRLARSGLVMGRFTKQP